MKYIEELQNGDAFSYKNKIYIISSDLDNKGRRNCLSLFDGFPKWFKPSETVELTQLFFVDENNHFIAIKETKKEE